MLPSAFVVMSLSQGSFGIVFGEAWLEPEGMREYSLVG